MKQDGPRQLVEATYPDGMRSLEVTDERPGASGSGLVYLNAIGDASAGGSAIDQLLHWSTGVDGAPRVSRVDYRNGETRATPAIEYDYGPHNEITETRSFNSDGSLRSRVVTDYLDDPRYEARHIFGLPKSVRTYQGNGATPVSRTDYFYDGFPLAQLSTPAVQHEDRDQYRGNVTTIVRYADAARLRQPLTERRTYDVFRECRDRFAVDWRRNKIHLHLCDGVRLPGGS